MKLYIDTDKKITKSNPMLFSSFVEHIGRAVYTGIYESTHCCSDKDGFREDVVELVKQLNVKYIRYPGGNFVSGYNWKNGIGDKSARPEILDLAWKQLEPNHVGVDEFMIWTRKIGAEPIMAVNMGTGTPQEAFELLQYCNGTVGYWAKLREKNGHKEPYNIKYWCIGNEMDGEWQIGHMTAEEYAKKAKTTAQMMKMFDPTLKLIFCGSSNYEMPTFIDWERTVIDICFDEIDYISAHRYYYFDKVKDKIEDYVESAIDFDNGIKRIEQVIEEVKLKHNSKKDIKISFDEWNVWHNTSDEYDWESLWTVAPKRAESVYTVLDSTVFASLLATLLNHSDSIGIACYAQLVNVIAPILTQKNGVAIKQSIYFPLELMSKAQNGYYVQCTNEDGTEIDKRKCIVCFIVDDEKKMAIGLICNLTDKVMEIELSSKNNIELKSLEQLSTNELFVCNSFDNPNRVEIQKTKIRGKVVKVQSYSWCVVNCSI